ncbi:MAG: PqqD family protein [Mogibacterium sp.]|nr:PqqD family protein [Mogibacterium sp.]
MFKKKEKSTENYLDKIPAICRGLGWSENEGIVTIRQENKGFYNKLAQRFFNTPEVSNIDLDEFGSFVWLCIDGRRDLFAIGEMIKEEFGDEAEPLYPRLIKFIQVLLKVKYIELS